MFACGLFYICDIPNKRFFAINYFHIIVSLELFFYLETEYFNEFNNKSPLLHTWTLSVEEQFYLVFPLLVIGVQRFAPKLLTWVLLVIFAASFACALYLTETNAVLSFYATHTRAWELMAGALVAIHQKRLRHWLCGVSSVANHKKTIDLSIVVALLVIAICVFSFSEKTGTPSISTVLSVSAAATILLVGADSGWARQALANRLMVSIGKLSYSLYIFHQPVNSFLYYSSFGQRHADTLQFVILSILITTVLSLTSYVLVERPIRYSNNISRRTILASVGFVGLSLLAVGYQGDTSGGLKDHLVAKYSSSGHVLLVDVDDEKRRVGELANRVYRQYNTDFAPLDRVRILVMGDSMANDAFLSLIAVREKVPNPEYAVRAVRVDDECMDTFLIELQSDAGGLSACLKDPSLPEMDLLKAKSLFQHADIILMTAIWQEGTYKCPSSEHLAQLAA